MQIQLNVLVLTTAQDKVFAVSTSKETLIMPNVDLSNIKNNADLALYVEKLYNKHIDLDISWNQPTLIDNSIVPNDKDENVFNVTYGCTAPNVQLVVKKGGFLLDVTEKVKDSNILKKLLCISV